MHPDPADVRAHALFASLDGKEIERLTGWLEIRTAQPGERLVPEGASGYTFFVIDQGTARVERNGKSLRDLGRGDFFGELAMLGEGRRTADVIATSPVTLFVLFGTEFRELETTMPVVATRIHEAMTSRLELET
jgi:CRP-like cAMP-binding protein